MEKQGVVAPGITPPERQDSVKVAADDLADHITKRAADAAAAALEKRDAVEKGGDQRKAR